MAGMFDKVSRFARSPKGREPTQKAQRYARDPETKRKIADARGRFGKRGGRGA